MDVGIFGGGQLKYELENLSHLPIRDIFLVRSHSYADLINLDVVHAREEVTGGCGVCRRCY